MNNQIVTLNTLLENYLSIDTNNIRKTIASRNLSSFTQKDDFLSTSMMLLTTY
jgi:hypothetical protein